MKGRKLRDILCENTQIRRLQPDVMNKVPMIVLVKDEDDVNVNLNGDGDGDGGDLDDDDDGRWILGTA